MVITIIVFGEKKCNSEEILQDIGKEGRTPVCKNTLIRIQYHVCNIYCVSVRPRLLFDLLKKTVEFAMMVKQIILGRKTCLHLQKELRCLV